MDILEDHTYGVVEGNHTVIRCFYLRGVGGDCGLIFIFMGTNLDFFAGGADFLLKDSACEATIDADFPLKFVVEPEVCSIGGARSLPLP